MKKGLLLLTLSLGILTAKAQQQAQYSQYMVNKYIVNPAVAGTQDNFVDFKLGYRNQWVGLEDAPKTIYFSANTPIGKPIVQPGHHYRGEDKNWHGAGVYIYNDQTGPSSRSGYYASYAYNLGINKYLRASVGFFLGVQQYSVDNSFWAEDLSNPNSPYFGQVNDPLLLNGFNKMVPDLSIGAWVYSKDFYIGISSYQLLGNQLDFQTLVQTNGQFEPSKLNRHYFVTAGINMPLNEELTIIPSFMVKVVSPAPPSVDLDVRAKHINGVWGGLAYRALDSFSALVGYSWTLGKSKKGHSISGQNGGSGVLDAGYAFDLTTSDLRKYNSGTHEIIIGYRLPLKGHIICASRFWH